jgi:uncharacterized protein YdeI (YjbR/CyaY-like superfamily)
MAGEEVLYFKSASELKKWFQKNHKKDIRTWMLFYKKSSGQDSLSYTEALELAMIFGWTSLIISRVDYLTFKALFLKRKPKSVWSLKNLKKFRVLQSEGKIHPAGLAAYQQRDKSKSEEKTIEFDQGSLKIFKGNKKAWTFFASQTPSYRKYMAAWVMAAKRSETKSKRLSELVQDSAEGTKLKRVVEANKKFKEKKSYPPGRTPIEEARNIGVVTATELRSLGIETLEQLKSLGWEKVFLRLCESYPHRLNRNMLNSLIGAVEDQDWRKLDPDLKAEALQLIYQLRRGF